MLARTPRTDATRGGDVAEFVAMFMNEPDPWGAASQYLHQLRLQSCALHRDRSSIHTHPPQPPIVELLFVAIMLITQAFNT